MGEKKQSKKDFNEYEVLMKQKFDLEDRQAHIFNEKWKLNNENTRCGQQLAIVEDQIRIMFDRMRIELKKESS